MERRHLLRTLLAAGATAVTAGCLSETPGATGPRNPPSEPENDPRRTARSSALRIDSFDIAETEDGSLRVFGTVENAAASERLARVRVVVVVGGDERTRTVEVEVSAESTAEFEAAFDVSFDAFANDGDLDLRLV